MSGYVETTSGNTAGWRVAGVRAFTGIPYALAPTPPHRFAAPRPITPWSGVRAMSRYRGQCPQILYPFLDPALDGDPAYDATRDFHRGIKHEDVPYDEDCLFLNVWTPAVTGKRPVMVWLHGGGFASGSGNWGWWTGETLARAQNVVVVTLNHRLNIFGYMYPGELPGAVANAGMLDIIAALGWVRDNISAFGGDPSNVTIFGQSGGGMKVSTLMAMPAARGLFHKAIVQSGPLPRAIPRDRAEATAARALKHLGVAPGDMAAAQALPVGALLDGFAASGEGTPGVPRQFGPVVDGDSLPADPFDPAASPCAAGVPMLIGATSDEITSLTGLSDPSIFTLDWADLPERVATHCAIDRPAAEAAIAAYRAARPEASASRLFIGLMSDWRFGYAGTVQAARQAVQAPVYSYLLSWRTPVQDGRLGAPHNLDLPLVFGRDKAPGITGWDIGHHALAAAVQTAWANFARTGDPNHLGLPEWPRYDATARLTMRLDSECRVESDPYASVRAALAALPVRV